MVMMVNPPVASLFNFFPLTLLGVAAAVPGTQMQWFFRATAGCH